MKIGFSMSDGVVFGGFMPVLGTVHHQLIQNTDGRSKLDVHLQQQDIR
jgi:hypothetical protein